MKLVVTEAGAKIVKKMMLCEIVVGRSFAVSDISSVGKEPLPNGFDSLYIFEGEKQNESPQTHKYFLKDSTQVLPTFLVTFEYDPIEEKRSREVKKWLCVFQKCADQWL